MKEKTLKADKRRVTGRKVKNLRKKNILPANIHGKDFASQSIQISEIEFLDSAKQVGETGVLKILFEGTEIPTLIHHIQYHPVTRDILHVDFVKVNLKEKITANVPVEIVGVAPAVKENKGTLLLTMKDVEVSALPAELPDKITVDVSGLAKVGDHITVGDLPKLPHGVILSDREQTVLQVAPIKVEKEEKVEPPTPVEGEKEEKPEEAASKETEPAASE